jgi:hypothetical protein
MIDGRVAVYRAIPETAALDRANDVLVLSDESRKQLERALKGHDDWGLFLGAVEVIDQKLVELGDIAWRWAREVQDAPVVHADQLALFRPELIQGGLAAA